MNVYSRHIPNFRALAGTKSIVKADSEMNLVKQEEEAKEFPTSQIIHQISGILVAASIGDLTGISAAVVPVITQWGLERFITPLMSERQSARLFQWAQQAAEGIAQRLANGEKYREDGFFDEIPTGRSKMDEVVESTLKKVMETTEEPKIKFMANLTEKEHFSINILKKYQANKPYGTEEDRTGYEVIQSG